MSIFAIADLHLSFSGEKPMDVFGADWIDHAARLKESWENLVTNADTVLVAGDISWAMKSGDASGELEWIASLPGRKILVRGNHDYWWVAIKRLRALHPDLEFLQNDFAESEGVAVCGTRGWVCPGANDFSEHDMKIYSRELLRFESSLKAAEAAGFSEKIAMLHYPPTNDRKMASGFTELAEKYGVDVMVYGHLHGRENFHRGPEGLFGGVTYRLVSLDYLRCEPVKIK